MSTISEQINSYADLSGKNLYCICGEYFDSYPMFANHVREVHLSQNVIGGHTLSSANHLILAPCDSLED